MYSLMFSLACCLRIDRSLFTVPSDTLSICAISPWIHDIDNNHEHFRTVEQIVSGDKGGMTFISSKTIHNEISQI
jgi:hypothetical protein